MRHQAWITSPPHLRRIPNRLLDIRYLSQGQARYSSTVTPSSLTSPTDLLPLPRSLPHRKGLLLLTLPVPPKNWPSHLEISSSLLSTTSTALKSSGIAVNAIYDGTSSASSFKEDKEEYPARLFYPDGTVYTFPAFNKMTLSSTSFLSNLGYTPKIGTLTERDLVNVVQEVGNVEILVCTHGSRDCRCSDKGTPLVQQIRAEIERRQLGEKVKVGEIAHVGGHKYAANALLLPSLDLLGNLSSADAPGLIDHVLKNRPVSSPIWKNWRGRYGLTEARQSDVWRKVDPDNFHRDNVEAGSSGGLTSENEGRQGSDPVKEVQLRFKTFEGEVKEVSAIIGESLLDVGKRHNLPALEGVCGGHLECATCHLYLPSHSDTPPPVPEASDEELDMLGYALSYKDGQSRLGCQIKVTPELVKWVGEGGVIGLPRF